MKWILFALLWILLLMVLKEVYGESKIDLLRCKRNHETEDIDGTDSSESIISTEIKDVEPFNTTSNDDKNTIGILKSVASNVPLKKIHKRRKNKKVKDDKSKSVVPSTKIIDKTDDDTFETNVVCKGDTEDKQEGVLNNISLIATETKEKEETSQSEEVETQCNNNETSQLNVESEAFINSVKLSNQQDSKEIDTIDIEKSNMSKNNDVNSFNESTNEIETQSINDEEEKSEESMQDKDSNSNEVSLPSKEFVNNLNSNEAIKETRMAKIPQENNSNCAENTRPQDKELTKKVEIQDTKQLLNQVSAEKITNTKQDLLTSSDILDVDKPTQRGKEKDLKSNICTSSDQNDMNNNEDNQKQGPALSYEQENLQHCIRRYYIYPPLSKIPQSNDLLNDQLTRSQSNRIDFPDNAYTDNFFYNMPNNGYINDYQVEDANGHRIPYTKSGDYNIKNNKKHCYPRNSYPQNLNYNSYNDNVYRNQYKKSTNIPNLNGYIPNCNILNYADKIDLTQDAKVSNMNKYITKSNENRNCNENAIKLTNFKNCNEHDFYSNDKSLAKETFSKINENYSKINREDIRTPNGFTINENIDRKISRDIQTEKFHSIDEEIWKSCGNRKLYISDCNKTN